MISRTEIEEGNEFEERKEISQTEGSSGPNELENSVNQILKRTQKLLKKRRKVEEMKW